MDFKSIFCYLRFLQGKQPMVKRKQDGLLMDGCALQYLSLDKTLYGENKKPKAFQGSLFTV